MKNNILALVMTLLLFGCYSMKDISYLKSKFESRNVLFFINFYDGYDMFVGNKQDPIDKFINNLMKNLNNSCIIPSDFIKIGHLYYDKEKIKKGNLGNVKIYSNKEGKVNGYSDNLYMYNDEYLIKYYPDNIVFIDFDFDEREKIQGLNLYIYGITGEMNKINIKGGLFTNLSKECIEKIAEITARYPLCNHDSLTTKELNKTLTDLENIDTRFKFSDVLKEIDALKNRYSMLEKHIKKNIPEQMIAIKEIKEKATEKIIQTYINYSESEEDKNKAIGKLKELLTIYRNDLNESQKSNIKDKIELFAEQLKQPPEKYNTLLSNKIIFDIYPVKLKNEITGFSNFKTTIEDYLSQYLSGTEYQFHYEGSHPYLLIKSQREKSDISAWNMDGTNFLYKDKHFENTIFAIYQAFKVYYNECPKLQYDFDDFLSNIEFLITFGDDKRILISCSVSISWGTSHTSYFCYIDNIIYGDTNSKQKLHFKQSSYEYMGFLSYEKYFFNFLVVNNHIIPQL
ncbi:MAG: hypothetical protein Q8M94_10570 [Ignavibacteria bacterium]|nr:hypothetical protein [Ignavibacteria bacterium]